MTKPRAANTRAWVLHPDIKNENRRRSPVAALAEAVSLARALPELEFAGSEIVRLAKAQPGLLFGKGKVAELKTRLHDAGVELVLVDGSVTPVQQRNLEKAWSLKILDRTGLILEIFSDRAHTREGVLQVEMAALNYQRTRLVRAWTHLERQRGGLGFVGGPGETQIEADRRAIDAQLARLKRQLHKVVKTRKLHRAARRKVPFPVVALVGYTNAGKSTLFNRLTGADVMVRDMLFATLDPTMRALQLPEGPQIILSDTVGFISDLPTELVAAFRATLEEVLEADLICHIRDISHPETEEQAADVERIIAQLGVGENIARIEVWNKMDLLEPEEQRRRHIQADRYDRVLATSALTGEGSYQLLSAFYTALKDETTDCKLTLGFADGKRRAWLHEQGVVKKEQPREDGFLLNIRWTPRQEKRYREL